MSRTKQSVPREEKPRICGKITITEEEWYIFPCCIRIWLDKLGRITISAAIREKLYIHHGDATEVLIDRSAIALVKDEPGYVLCGGLKGTVPFRGKRICIRCLEEI